MLKLSKISFTYLIIQPKISIPLPKTLSKSPYFPDSIGVPIPIPLNGVTKLDDKVSNFLDYIELHAVKGLNVQTSTTTLLNSANALLYGESGGSTSTSKPNVDSKGNVVINSETQTEIIKWQNPNLTYVERGDETFSLVIKGGVGNILTPIIDTYMEVASKTTLNVRFHYISNNLLMFNMILQNYNIDKSDQNPVLSFQFYKPETALAQKNETVTSTKTLKV